MTSTLEKARHLDKKYHVFNALAEEEIFGEGYLKGVAVSFKDNICVKGIPSTAGSKILKGYIPPFDATVVTKCRKEGAFIIGKTTQDEFGFGTFNVNTEMKVPVNPHDPNRSTGGSSGGGAGLTAVADFPHMAVTESTGGSISCPASFCGVVGITPTYGRTSRWGLIDYANSLDKIGAMGKTVDEVATILSIISGPDKYDSTVLKRKPEDYRTIPGEIQGMHIGVPKEYFGEGVDPGVEKKVWASIKNMESHGAQIKKVTLPHTKFSLSSYYIIAMAEASTNLAKFCGLRYGLHFPLLGNFNDYFSDVRTEGFGEEAIRRIILGTFSRMAGYRNKYYLKAMKVRTKVIEDFKKVFRKVDVLASPTMPVIAPRFDEIERMEPIQHYMMDILTVAPNLAGIPMISIPCGKHHGMPVGLHLISDHFMECKILQAAKFVEAL
jgi:aspartyl-tRNA(Asn)/glutamyl-tRNA(Gln) amidotransferase subunit A